MKLRLIGVCVLLALTLGAAGTGWSLHQVPAFYHEALRAHPDAALRQQQAEHFVQRTKRLVEDMHHEEEWSQEFTQEQVNSWLAEELPRQYAHWLPEGVNEPRIHFSENMIEVGFRYTDLDWETVVITRLKPRLLSDNRLSVEFVGAQAGLIPIPLDDFLTELSFTLTQAGWDYEWTERDGNQVLVVPLTGGQHNQPLLEMVKLEPGILRLAGRRRFPNDTQLTKLLLASFELQMQRQR